MIITITYFYLAAGIISMLLYTGDMQKKYLNTWCQVLTHILIWPIYLLFIIVANFFKKLNKSKELK